MNNNEIIIYGAGNQGRAARNVLESQGLYLTAFADKDERKVAFGAWEGTKVISLDNLRAMDKETPIIIGIGAARVDLLREIDNMLTSWGFTNIFWSAVEFMEKAYPGKELNKTYYGIGISTNVGCSIACKWCAQKLHVSKYKERLSKQAPDLPKDYMMTFETFKKCIDKVPKNASVNFCGFSEPFLNPQTTDMILYTAEKGHEIALLTTLVGLSEKNFERLKNVEFDFITPHLPDKDGNATIPVTDDYLKLLIKFFKTFEYAIGSSGKQRGLLVSFHGEINPKVFETLKNAGIDLSLYRNASEKARPIAGHVIPDYSKMIPLPHNNFPLYCGSPLYSQMKDCNKDDIKFLDETLQITPFVFPNGDVTICDHDYGLDLILGNLFQSEFIYFFKDNILYNKIRIAQSDPTADILCRKCEFAVNANQINMITRNSHLN
ncbi:MAG: SPASM domain-containing protein [Treponema sp.]|nr:SPASM domain-containing protein [Treponema sp.]